MAEKKKADQTSVNAKSDIQNNEPASISLDGGSNKKKVSKKGLESLSYSDYYKKYLESKKEDFELLAKKASTDTIKDNKEIKEEIKAEAFYADSALDYTKELKNENYSDHFKKMENIDQNKVVFSNEMKYDSKKEQEGEFVVRNQYHPSFNDVIPSSNSYDDLPSFNDLNAGPSYSNQNKQIDRQNNNFNGFERPNAFDRQNQFDRLNQPIPSRMYIPRGYIRPINPFSRSQFNPYFNPYPVPPYYYQPHPGFSPYNQNPYNQFNNQQNPFSTNPSKNSNKQEQGSYTQQLMDFDPFASTAELAVVNNDYNPLTNQLPAHSSNNQNELVVANKKQPELSHIISSFNKRMKEQLRIVAKQNEMIERLQTKVIELTEEKVTALIEQSKISTEDFAPTTQHNFEAVVTDTIEQEEPVEKTVEVIGEILPEVSQPAPIKVEQPVEQPQSDIVVDLSEIEVDDPVVTNIWAVEPDDLIDTEKLDEELAAFEEFDSASVEDELDLSLLEDEIIDSIQPQIKYEATAINEPVQSEYVKHEELVQDSGLLDLDLSDDDQTPESEEIYTPNELLDLGKELDKEQSDGIKNSIVPTNVIDEMFGDQQKSDPSRRFWEGYVGNSDYGFYNNKTWNWKGKFSKLQKWIPFTHDDEVPFYGTKHVILSAIKSSERKKFWKELIGDPVYGHFEGSSKVWIWHGVFDQELNWIPDPTHEFKTEEEVLSQKQKQSFPKKKEPAKKPSAPKVLKTTEITPESDLHKILLDDPRYKKHIGNEEYGYYDNDGVWIWTGSFDDEGNFKPDKVELDILSDATQSESNFSSLFESWKKNNQNNLEYEIESRKFKTSKTNVVYVDEQEQPEDDLEILLDQDQEESFDDQDLVILEDELETKPTKNELIRSSIYNKPKDEDLGILTWDRSKIHNDRIIDASVLEESSSLKAPFWLEFVGDDNYGHYNTKGDWVFDGYFDDEYEFVSTRRNQQVEEAEINSVSKTSILEEHGDLDEYFKPANKEEFLTYTPKPRKVEETKKEEPFFNKFIGDSRYGFYNDNNVWIWNGYFTDEGEFISDSAPKVNKILEEVAKLAFEKEQEEKQQLLREEAQKEYAAREEALLKNLEAKQQQLKEQLAQEYEAKEQALRELEARQQLLKEQTEKEYAAREEALLKDLEARQQLLKEQTAKEYAAREEEALKELLAKQAQLKEQLDQEYEAKQKALKELEAKQQALKEQAIKDQEAREEALRLREQALNERVLKVKEQALRVKEESLRQQEARELAARELAAREKELAEKIKKANELKDSTKFIKPNKDNYKSIHQFVGTLSDISAAKKEVQPVQEIQQVVEDQVIQEVTPIVVDLNKVELPTSQFDSQSVLVQPQEQEVKQDIFAKKELDLTNVQFRLADESSTQEVLNIDVSKVELPEVQYKLQPTKVEVVQPTIQPTIFNEELASEVINVQVSEIQQPTFTNAQPVVQSYEWQTTQESNVQQPTIATQESLEAEEVKVSPIVADQLLSVGISSFTPKIQPEPIQEAVTITPVVTQAVDDYIAQPVIEEKTVEQITEEVIVQEQPIVEESVQEQAVAETVAEEVVVEQPIQKEVQTQPETVVEEIQPEEPAVEEVVEEVTDQTQPEVSTTDEYVLPVEQAEVEESVAEEIPSEETDAQEESAQFWEKFVGDENYGHYNEEQEWVWAGYFDENQQFIKEEAQAEEVISEEAAVEETPAEETVEDEVVAEESSAQEETQVEESVAEETVEEQTEVEEGEFWEKFVGDENYGYYNEEQEWVWAGYFDENQQFIKEETEQSETEVTEESTSEENPVKEEVAVEETTTEEETPAEEASEEAEYWEQFVGNEEYGHYDENEEWVWDGYFDDDNNFIKEETVEESVEEVVEDVVEEEPTEEEVSEEAEADEASDEETEVAEQEEIEEVEVEGENYIYADENGEINFDDYIGNENFGYYLEDGEWEWYEGDFDENGNWFVYVQGEAEEVNVEEDIPALKGVDTDSVDADDWLSQFDEDAASAIFDDENADEDDYDDFDFGDKKKKDKKKKDKKSKK
ncbi:EAGR box-containing protein [Mycoplasma bradburyae]|uniref:EAGR box-containing protein n=1 Tax=Mycoplasma bradburyae TaxID=2963128 RepID=UPI0023424E0B|nr:EAGR box-containing protein [Mycoplasma bradburyae]MDC4182815.1 EAGR box-containing protein [Mycoplasma bradburyae]